MATSRSVMPTPLRLKAVSQSGIVSRQQALEGGMSRSAIRERVVSRRWKPVYRGVYAIFTGKLGRRSQLWAAVLYAAAFAGDGAVLSHETAAELHNLEDEQAPAIHVTVPHGRQVRSAPGLVVHRSRRIDAGDDNLAVPEGELPRTGAEETILDLAADMDDADDVCALVAKAFARNRTGVEFMKSALEQRERQKWRAEIEEFIAAAEGGAHSVLEYRYDRDVEKAHGLPVSRHQVPFTKKDGSKGYRDRVYEKYKVIVELDGNLTHTGDRQWEDKKRDNTAAEGGEQSLRYGWQDVRWDPCGTALQIVRVLRKRGWKGTPVPCGHGCPLDAPAAPAAPAAPGPGPLN